MAYVNGCCGNPGKRVRQVEYEIAHVLEKRVTLSSLERDEIRYFSISRKVISR